MSLPQVPGVRARSVAFTTAAMVSRKLSRLMNRCRTKGVLVGHALLTGRHALQTGVGADAVQAQQQALLQGGARQVLVSVMVRSRSVKLIRKSTS